MEQSKQNNNQLDLQGDESPYRVTFKNRVIRVNGFRLSKPNFDSENEVVFSYIFENPNRKITLTEIETATGRPVNKKLYDVIRSLGFRKELKAMFFPHIAKTALEFVNPVSKAGFRRR